jgi:hypothetical protein
MIKQVTYGVKLLKELSNEPFLGTADLNIVIDNPESIVEVMSSVIGDDRIQLLTEWFNLYHSQNIEKCKVSPKTLKWSIFSRTMIRNRFESIWLAWQFSDISQETQDSERLFKIWPVCEYFVQKYRSVYSPKQEQSLDEAMIPWWGRLKFRTNNPGNITKYCW